MDTLEKFQDWSDQHHTHVRRHIVVLNKQAEVLRSYVELVKQHPVNTEEFMTEIQKLHLKTVVLVDELGEVNLGFVEDCERFSDVLDSLKQDFLKAAGK